MDTKGRQIKERAMTDDTMAALVERLRDNLGRWATIEDLLSALKPADLKFLAERDGTMRVVPMGELLDMTADICMSVAELPDRTSPDDAPDMMTVSRDELQQIVTRVLGAAPKGETK